MTTASSPNLAAISVSESLETSSAKDAVALQDARGSCEIRLLADRVPNLRTGSTHKFYRGWRFAVVMLHGQPEQGSTVMTVPIDPARLATSRSRYALVLLAAPGALATETPVAFAWSASSVGTTDPFAVAQAQVQRQLAAAGWTPDTEDATHYAKSGPTLAVGKETAPPASASAAHTTVSGDTTEPGLSQSDRLSLTNPWPAEEPGLDRWEMDGGASAAVSARSAVPGSGEYH